MTLIHLHTATTDNAGRYCPAGDRVPVGDGPGSIAPDRARALVQSGGAVDVSPRPRKGARAK